MLTQSVRVGISFTLAVLASGCSVATPSAASQQQSIGLCPLVSEHQGNSWKQNYYAADGSMQTLVVSDNERLLAACESQGLPVDGRVVWAAPASAEQVAEANFQVGLQGTYTAETVTVSDIIMVAQALSEPQADVADKASPTPQRAQPQAIAGSAVLPHVRGAWFWSPQLWLDSTALIWQAQTDQALSEIYVSVPVTAEGKVEHAQQLQQFITQASARGLEVWVVIGDPHDVLPSSLPAIENRINAFLNYNRAVDQAARLAGIQLDIEPYLLPGFGRAHAFWRDKYASVVRHDHSMVDAQVPLELVMPAWWGIHHAWGEHLFAQLPTDNTRISIMNYHTDGQRLRANTAPFLAWAERSSVPVVVALESGALQDETHRRYTRNDHRGELWLLALGDEYVFALFDRPQRSLPGQAFAYSFDYPVPASDYTFNGDIQQLNRIAAKLSSEWQASPAFAGIAIHGLDDSRVGQGGK